MFEERRIHRSPEELREKFTRLGVDDIEFQIEDELDESSNPRLAPLVMFHRLWEAVVRKGDTSWIDGYIEHFEARQKLSGLAACLWQENDAFLNGLRAVKASGIDLNHITAIVRQMQDDVLNHLAWTLSDSRSGDELFRDVNWGLFETDEDGNPLRQMNVLHYYYPIVEPDADKNG